MLEFLHTVFTIGMTILQVAMTILVILACLKYLNEEWTRCPKSNIKEFLLYLIKLQKGFVMHLFPSLPTSELNENDITMLFSQEAINTINQQPNKFLTVSGGQQAEF